MDPFFESDNFALPKLIPCVEFSKHLPENERNILLTGDSDQEFDPYTYS
jgi:hypothetical protein